MKTFLTKILDLIFPTFCVICEEHNNTLCHPCANDLKSSKKNLTSFVFSLYNYEDVRVSKIIKSIKYKNNTKLAVEMGKLLAINLLNNKNIKLSECSNIFLVPIPIHAKRLKVRGYNQSMLLANGMHEYLLQNSKIKTQCINLLEKIKVTDNLYKMTNIDARLLEMNNSMSIANNELIIDEKDLCILIDDVTTTGATIFEAKRAINSFAKCKVIAYTIAN